MIKTCVLCGKSFIADAQHAHRQILCSDECRKLYQAEFYRKPEERKKRRDYKRERASTVCILCGKQIIRDYELSENASTSRMHDECVFEDCRKTILAGKTISHVQQLRLYARGYTIKEFKAEMNEEAHE